MSSRLISRILRLPMHPMQKAVFSAVGDSANDEGLCYPSLSCIAHRASISPWQARRAMRDLISEDWISVVSNDNGGALSMSRRCQINVRKLQADVVVKGDP